MSRQSLYNWVKENRLPAYRVAGRLTVKGEELEGLIAERGESRLARARRLTQRELATVLAALRHWQRTVPEVGRVPSYPDLFAGALPLNDAQIDRLCEELNTGAAA